MLSSDATCASSEQPAVDERLVAPEIRYEVLDGGLGGWCFLSAPLVAALDRV